VGHPIYAGSGLRLHGTSDNNLFNDDGECPAGLIRHITGSESHWRLTGHPEKACQGIGPETNEELINVIIMAGEDIKMPLVNKLVDSMPEQSEEVMTNEGGHISY
jgi:hypothetical protein